jgi:hypothetical protein
MIDSDSYRLLSIDSEISIFQRAPTIMSTPSDPGFQGIDQTSLDSYLFRIAAAVTTSTEQVPSDHLDNPDPNPSWDLGSNYRYYPNFTAPGGGTTNFDDHQASVNLHPSHLNTRWESDSDIQTPADGDTVIGGSGPHVIAYIINSQGSVFPITGEAQPQNIEGHSKLHFLGFLILDDAMMVKPFFVSSLGRPLQRTANTNLLFRPISLVSSR